MVSLLTVRSDPWPSAARMNRPGCRLATPTTRRTHTVGEDLDLELGNKELVLHNRYETLSIVNDVLIALWFIIGSILFFSESTTTIGTWFFLAGSVELLIRPVIRLSRNVHITTVSKTTDTNNY